MTIKNLLQNTVQKIVRNTDYEEREAQQIGFQLLEKVAQFFRTDYVVFADKKKLTPMQQIAWDDAIQELLQNNPLQYILGEAHFYGRDFTVNENVLIPRPETEELVDWIIQESQEKDSLKVLDIGTGSGCIAISLALELKQAQISAWDISEEALEVARGNSKKLNARVTFQKVDILSFEKEGITPQKFDLIVSNPPYVTPSEKAEMRKNVLEFEPSLALFTPEENPLIFYECIANFAKKYLKPNGQLFFEINQYQGKPLMELLEINGFQSIELRQDLSGNARMMKVEF